MARVTRHPQPDTLFDPTPFRANTDWSPSEPALDNGYRHHSGQLAYSTTGVDGVLAGREITRPQYVAALADAGVRYILDLRDPSDRLPSLNKEVRHELDACGIERMNVRVPDGSAPSRENIHEIRYWMGHLDLSAHSVYVHCRAGVERTSAALLAYVETLCDVKTPAAARVLQAHRYLRQSYATYGPLYHQFRAVLRVLAPGTECCTECFDPLLENTTHQCAGKVLSYAEAWARYEVVVPF